MKTTDTIGDIAREACAGLIPGAVVLPVPNDAPENENTNFAAVIGFSGDGIRGVVGLTVSDEIVRTLHPSNEEILSESALADWTGELANQLLGRLKLSLLKRGITLWVATPLVLRGIKIRFIPGMSSEGNTLRKYRFETSAGVFWTWLDIHFDEPVELAPEPEIDTHMNSGDFIFF